MIDPLNVDAELRPWDGLGLRVKGLRKQHGWTQQALARRTGIARNTIGGVESGRWLPRVSSLWRLSRVFHVSIHWLVTGEAWDGHGDDGML